MPIFNKQLENAPRKFPSADVKPETLEGEGAFYVKEVDGIAEGFYVDDQGKETQLTEDGALKVSGVGEVNTAANVGAGAGLFKAKSGTELQFKTLVAGSNVTLTPDTDTITIDATGGGSGEANDGENLGSGEGVYAQKSSETLQFKSLKAGANVTISSTETEITIAAEAGEGGGASSLEELTDVDIDSPEDGDALVYNSSTQKWEAGAIAGGGASPSYFTVRLGPGSDIATRVSNAPVGGIPDGWTVTNGNDDLVSEALSGNEDDLIVIHGQGKYAIRGHVIRKSVGIGAGNWLNVEFPTGSIITEVGGNQTRFANFNTDAGTGDTVLVFELV